MPVTATKTAVKIPIFHQKIKNMNLKLTLIAPFCLLLGNLFAQIPAVTETEKLMSLGTRPALRVEFLNAKPGYVGDLWEDFLKKELGAKSKYDKKKKESMAADVNAPILSAAAPVDFYTKSEEAGTATNFTLWLDTGNDDFVSKKAHPESFKETEALLSRFAKQVRIQQTTDLLKAEEKKQKDFESDLKKLQKEKDNLEKDIENWKKKIAKTEEDLKTNASDQVKKTQEIEQQAKAILNVQEKLIEVERSN